MPRTQRCSPRHGQSVSPQRPDTANGADGISDIEGKAARGSSE